MEKPVKEKENKLNYEIDWSFIEKMAQRMAMNKDKYDLYSWKKWDNIDEINQALTRHFINIQKGNYSDEQKLGHYIAMAINSMFAVYHLERKELEFSKK